MLFHCAATLSRLSQRVLYALADGLIYPVMYYIVRYRRRLVRANLRSSFPDKTGQEIRQIERAFYHQFCNTIVETLYGWHCSNDEIRKRVQFANSQDVEQAAREHGGCVVMLAHVGNWEWMSSNQQWMKDDVTELNVYRQLKNPEMDRLMLEIRKQRGGAYVEKQRVLREMVRFRAEKKPIVLGLIADQKPRPEVTRTWVQFLNHETGFLDGGEELAKKFGYPVFFLHVLRPKRGYYQTRFDILSMDPKHTAEGEITTAYARALEANIQEQPELWLWTHNRFKFKRVKVKG